MPGLSQLSLVARSEAEKDPLAVELGRRIDEAWALADFSSRADMIRATGLPDANAVHKYCRGETLPGIKPLAAIARTCRVSLDWLVFGGVLPPIQGRGFPVEQCDSRSDLRLAVDLGFWILRASGLPEGVELRGQVLVYDPSLPSKERARRVIRLIAGRS